LNRKLVDVLAATKTLRKLKYFKTKMRDVYKSVHNLLATDVSQPDQPIHNRSTYVLMNIEKKTSI